MPSFDIVSQVDMQEVRNAVDQSMREVVNRYDFKGTDTKISLDRRWDRHRIGNRPPC